MYVSNIYTYLCQKIAVFLLKVFLGNLTVWCYLNEVFYIENILPTIFSLLNKISYVYILIFHLLVF